jgi:hypothetical protein
VIEILLRLFTFRGLAVNQVCVHHDHRKEGNVYSLRPVMRLNFPFQHENILAAPIVLVDQTTSRAGCLSSFRLWAKSSTRFGGASCSSSSLPPPIPAVSFASLKARPSCNKVSPISIHPSKRQQRRLFINSLRDQSYTVSTISQLKPRQMLHRESLGRRLHHTTKP